MSDTQEKHIKARADLGALTSGFGHLQALLDVVLDVWPEHAAYLLKSFSVRTPSLMETSDKMAAATLQLAGAHQTKIAEDYQWLCDQIREEELFFARNGRYRHSTFAQTNAHVYSDQAFMERYMHGLLYSHVLWYMHLSSLHFFQSRLAARVPRGGRVLEVGSGHGLLLFLALRDLQMASATAWDLSQVSLDQTRDALHILGMDTKAEFVVQDMQAVEPSGDHYDLIILSHLLEHLEEPTAPLERMRNVTNKKSTVFINVPLNAPMPDHLVLLRTPQEAIDLVEKGGFSVLEIGSHTNQGIPLPSALKREVAVTCSIIAQPK